MTKAERENERNEAKAMLFKWLKPGDTILTVVRSYSRTGMTRTIDFYIIDPKPMAAKPTLIYLTGYMAKVLGQRRNKDGAIVTSNDAFSEVLNLSYALWGIRPLAANETKVPHLRHERI